MKIYTLQLGKSLSCYSSCKASRTFPSILFSYAKFLIDCRCPWRYCCFSYSCSNRGTCFFSSLIIFTIAPSVSCLLLINFAFLSVQVVKQRLQTRQFASAPDAVRLIVSKEGFKGLYAVR